MQFQQREPSTPKQFEPRDPSTPRQFKVPSAEAPPSSSLAAQFAGPKKAKPETAETENPKMVPGAWIRPAKAADATKTTDVEEPESKKDDDSSDDDGDFDALANIILLD